MSFPVLRMKPNKESGVNPEQSRCCIWRRGRKMSLAALAAGKTRLRMTHEPEDLPGETNIIRPEEDVAG